MQLRQIFREAYDSPDPDRVLRMALKSVRDSADASDIALIEGAILYNRDYRERAFEKFHIASCEGKKYEDFLKGVHAVRQWEADPAWKRPAQRKRALSGPIYWLKQPKRTSVTVVFVADPVYFERHARSALNSLTESSCPVHFHVVGWSESIDQLVSDLLLASKVSVSTEPYHYSDDYTYFATARFLRAYDFLRAMGPLYLSDIDNRFFRKPEEQLRIYRRYDLCVKESRWRKILPWAWPNAGTLFVNDKPRAIEFLLLMQNYIDHRFLPNRKTPWYFDQLMLNEVLYNSNLASYRLTGRDIASHGRRLVVDETGETGEA